MGLTDHRPRCFCSLCYQIYMMKMISKQFYTLQVWLHCNYRHGRETGRIKVNIFHVSSSTWLTQSWPGDTSFLAASLRLWNNLPVSLRHLRISTGQVRNGLKVHRLVKSMAVLFCNVSYINVITTVTTASSTCNMQFCNNAHKVCLSNSYCRTINIVHFLIQS